LNPAEEQLGSALSTSGLIQHILRNIALIKPATENC
jgi:hypothetical protein